MYATGAEITEGAYRAGLEIEQPWSREERELSGAHEIEPVKSRRRLVRVARMRRVGRERTTDCTDQQQDGAETPIAKMEADLHVALELGPMKVGEICIDVDEVCGYELVHEVSRRVYVLFVGGEDVRTNSERALNKGAVQPKSTRDARKCETYRLTLTGLMGARTS